MSIDWSHLNARTSGFATTEVTRDTTDTVVDVLCVGLHVRMSDLVSHFPAAGGSTLTVFVDTLVMDIDTLVTRGTVILARVIDVGAMQGGSHPVVVPTSGAGTTAVEILAGDVIGGQLALTGPGGDQPFAVPSGIEPLRAASFFIDTKGSVTSMVNTSADDIGDLTGRVYALNGFRASFSAATWLVNYDDSDAGNTARAMFAWVVACTAASAQATAKKPAAWEDLNAQAAPLLVELNVKSGVTYVPSLSSGFYKTQVTLLLDALDSYTSKIASLESATNLQQAIDSVSAALADVAATELAPLDQQLETLRQNLKDLSVGINSLDLQFAAQSSTVDVKFAKLRVALTEAQIKAWFEAVFQLSISAIKIGFDGATLATKVQGKPPGEGDGDGDSDIDDDFDFDSDSDIVIFDDQDSRDGLSFNDADSDSSEEEENGDKPEKKADPRLGPAKGIITESLGAADKAISAIIAVSKHAGEAQKPLLNKAQELVDVQRKLIESYAVSTGRPTELGVYTGPALFSIDPALAWDNYMAEASIQLSKLSVGAAGSFLVSLTVLSNYGKAIAAKIVTSVSQQAQFRIVESQREATVQAAARWQELQGKATGEQEKLAGLIGVLESRADAIRRSLYVAWSHYRDSYFFLYFRKPPISVNLDMSTAELRSAFAKAAVWVGQLLDSDQSGRVRLPKKNVKLQFEFDICTKDSNQASVNSALFTPASGDSLAMLTWSIPIGTKQLVGVLPKRGQVAIWINEAAFYLDGVMPNSRGNVMAEVSTSGTYENGFGPGRAHEFVAKSMVGDYAYSPGSDLSQPYKPWIINTAVYMTPTPYTQWTMVFERGGGDASTASKLRMDLTVSYREDS